MTAATWNQGDRLTAFGFNRNIPGPWVPFQPLNGCSNVPGQIFFQARKFNSVTALVVGTLDLPSSAPDGLIIGQMPDGMIPATTQGMNGTFLLDTTVAGTGCNITVRNTGAIVLFSAHLPSANYLRIGFDILITLDG
jgi:hypothetical protein